LHVRVYAWQDMNDADPTLHPARVGRLVAAMHQVDFEGKTGLHDWYTAPVGAARWDELLGELRAAHTPFAEELASFRGELIALEALLGHLGELRTCHRDLWADNLRATGDGSLCVFDFENSGLMDPSQELATVLFEFCSWDAGRARTLLDAYAAAGGPGRVSQPHDFGMAIAQQGFIVDLGCRRWLAASTDEDRADNEAWVREFLDRPLTRAVIEELLSA
jgi:aminoglycoside phosphotransferase (APT) family kinase protein